MLMVWRRRSPLGPVGPCFVHGATRRCNGRGRAARSRIRPAGCRRPASGHGGGLARPRGARRGGRGRAPGSSSRPRARQHLLVLHGQLAPHAVMVKGLRAALGHDVEAGQVSARRAAVPVGSGPVWRRSAANRRPAPRAGHAAGPGRVPASPNTLMLTIWVVAIVDSSRRA